MRVLLPGLSCSGPRCGDGGAAAEMSRAAPSAAGVVHTGPGGRSRSHEGSGTMSRELAGDADPSHLKTESTSKATGTRGSTSSWRNARGDFRQFVSNETVTVKIITVSPGTACRCNGIRSAVSCGRSSTCRWISPSTAESSPRSLARASGCRTARSTGSATALTGRDASSRSPSGSSTSDIERLRTTTPADSWASRREPRGRRRRGPPGRHCPTGR